MYCSTGITTDPIHYGAVSETVELTRRFRRSCDTEDEGSFGPALLPFLRTGVHVHLSTETALGGGTALEVEHLGQDQLVCRPGGGGRERGR